MNTLAEYLSAFEAPKPTAPAQSGMVQKSVSQIQAVLHALGVAKTTANSDGKFGSTTQKQWAAEAQKRGMNPGIDRASATSAWVNQGTYDVLSGLKTRTQATTVPMPTPARPAWQQRLDANQAAANAARPTPSAAPVPVPVAPRAVAAPAPAPTVAGVTKTVAELQAIVLRLGAQRTKALTDGLWGAATVAAWQSAARSRGLPTTIVKTDAKRAKVPQQTFDQLVSATPASSAAVPATTPAAAVTTPAPSAAGLIDKSVSELQSILHSFVAKTKANSDGLFGPTTQKQWVAEAQKRGLDKTFARVSGSVARVSGETYTRLKAAAVAAKPAASSATAMPSTADSFVTILTVQKGLNGTGIKPMLDTDGVWGPRTQNAYNTWLRVQPGGMAAKYTVSGKSLKMPSAYAQSLTTLAANAPSPPERVSVSVAQVKQALRAANRPVGTGVMFDNTTKKSFDAFLTQVESGVNTGYKVSADKKTLQKVRKNVVEALGDSARTPSVAVPEASSLPALPSSAGATPAAAQTTSSAQDPIQVAARTVAGQATAPIAVMTVQQALAATGRYPEVRPTGIWDEPTQGAFITAIGVAEQFKPVWIAALSLLLSPDGSTVRLLPKQAETFTAAARIYQERVADEQARRTAEMEAQARQGAPMAPPEPLPLPAAAPEQQAPQALSPAPTDGPMPTADAPAPSMEPVPQPAVAQNAAGEEAWMRLVQSLQMFAELAPKYAEQMDAAAAAPGGVSPEAAATFNAWLQSAERLKQRAAQLIEQSPQLRATLDAAAPSVGFAGFAGYSDGYRRYFEGLGAAADSAIELLKKPIEFAGLRLRRGGFESPAVAVGWAARLTPYAGAAWAKLLQLLGTRAVATASGVAAGAAGLNSVMNQDVESFETLTESVAKLVAEGKLSAAEAQAIVEAAKPQKTNVIVPLVVGATLLGGFALWLNSSGGKHA